MRKVLTVFFVLLSLFCFSQSNYENGFNDGYKSGYCYGTPNSLSPIPPIAPIPKPSESYDSYQDGYNRGFVMGQAAKTEHDSKYSNNGGGVVLPDARQDIINYYATAPMDTPAQKKHKGLGAVVAILFVGCIVAPIIILSGH